MKVLFKYSVLLILIMFYHEYKCYYFFRLPLNTRYYSHVESSNKHFFKLDVGDG